MNRQNRHTSDLPTLNDYDPYQSGPWHRTSRNPAEDTWHVSVDEFLLAGFASTHKWLSERLEFSRKLAEATDPGYSVADLHIRACSNSWRLEIDPRQKFFYWTLNEANISELAKESLMSIFKAIDNLDPVYRPSGLLLTYDDDYQILHNAARVNEELYRKYCVSKGLV